MTDWDPDQYLRFEDQRLRPALDLIVHIDGSPAEIWDLGCGTGSITALLGERWPTAAVHGLDSSPEMIDRARRIADIDWVLGDIAAWEVAAPVDLVFSNAALHWLGEHELLLPRLTARVATGGTLAVQMPRNFAAPSHALLAEIAATPRWIDRVGDVVRPPPVAEPAFYHDLLRALFSSVEVWETEYLHCLTGTDPVAEWARGTAARPFIDALGDAAGEFMEEYSSRLRVAYPPRPDGTTLFAFKRLFIVGRR
ncbi:MAG: hypothetical protein A2Z12_07615 [Actinobacteria bacterium RBG_16_68_21]|nr:MAG: hypothetical protein A2Z12_07615 [Actinobacteria bacterium RBG_16_68_21]